MSKSNDGVSVDTYLDETLPYRLKQLEEQVEKIQLTFAHIRVYSEYDDKWGKDQMVIALEGLGKLLDFPWDEYKDYVDLGANLKGAKRFE